MVVGEDLVYSLTVTLLYAVCSASLHSGAVRADQNWCHKRQRPGLARTIGAGASNILAGILHFHRGYRFPSLNATSKHTWITQAYVMDAFFWSFLVFVATSKYV